MDYKDNVFTQRQSVDKICSVPEKIISVYSLEKHVWADSNSIESRNKRLPELKSIEEFQFDPVRPFLTDVLKNMAAPYKPEKRDYPIGQGYWIQAEFGSGKSHLLCVLSALALGKENAWRIIDEKEKKIGKGKRESLYRFWEEGIRAKSGNGNKGIFVIVKTLVGAGSGTIGLSDKGKRLTEYILDAAKEQLQIELGKNISLYPVELLADRFLKEDIDRYRNDLKKFLKDPHFFDDDEFEEIGDFINDIQQNKSPEYKRSCGNKLWRFYTEYLKVRPQIAAESEDILKHMAETIMHEGYSGILLVLDEVSLFMKNRDPDQRDDDERTLVVLSNRLAKIHNLPVWTICAAQQAIESKLGVKNIIADDRLKLVKLLENDKDYYDIVLSRMREIIQPDAINNYYLYYKKGFTWPNSIGESEFTHFFPFYKPAIEVLRAITFELTTTRSAIHFMHQTLKHQIKKKGDELIRLWELFDETVKYEEDPSGVHAGLVAIKTKKEIEYRAYESCKRQIEGLTKGLLKHYQDKAIKIIQTLFLYHVSKIRQKGISPEEISNSVLIERDSEANADENIQHYETLADNLKKELRQIVQSFDEENRPFYRFDPVFTGVDPRDEFRKARDEVETHEVLLKEAWYHLLAMNEWPVRTRQMIIDLSNGIKSIFRDIASVSPEKSSVSINKDHTISVTWNGRAVSGIIGMRDFRQLINKNQSIPAIESDQTDNDFSVYIGIQSLSADNIRSLIERRKDPRIIVWVPDELTREENERLIDFAAYKKLVSDWHGNDSEDAVAVINWVSNTLQTELGKIIKIIELCYNRGRMDSLHFSQMEFHIAGELPAILTPLIEQVLSAAYLSDSIKFERPFIFRNEEAVKVINGIVRTGNIPKGTKPNQNISAAQNFGFGLDIIKRSNERKLDITDNAFADAIWYFIDDKLESDTQIMRMETLYKNFMGTGGGQKDYGLSRRMVQLYVLCLVKEGKIKVTLSAKSGLSYNTIDYGNISDTDFSAKILDSMLEIQKMVRPENWEILKPFAEKLLRTEVPQTHEDAVISKYRQKLHVLFEKEREISNRICLKAKALFDYIKKPNPYGKELDQLVRLFNTEIHAGDDIDRLLYSLKEIFDYKAYETNSTDQKDIDDFQIRLKNYDDLKNFLEYEREIKTAFEYSKLDLPDNPDFDSVRKNLQKTEKIINNLQAYIDSEVKLKTEFIGTFPKQSGDNAVLSNLIEEYSLIYSSVHDMVTTRVSECQKSIDETIDSKEMRALSSLENISALKPEISDHLKKKLSELKATLFSCTTPSHSSVKDQLRFNPFHECGLSLIKSSELITQTEEIKNKATILFDNSLNEKINVFMNPVIREKLKQGQSESVIKSILACSKPDELKDFIINKVIDTPDTINIINKYLKRIIVKQVKLSDFKPSLSTIESKQIPIIVSEFEDFLKENIKTIDGGDDSLSMIRIE
ncbi:MAG: hypothetical protein JXB88_03110 [Spirochaetales bacterium]|nr:hypothetical protein [Spirochaetales bacterium]